MGKLDDRNPEKNRPWAELRDTGLLWLINATVFHPRGYALAVHYDGNGDASGWSILGDGNESWGFAGDDETTARVDDLFRRVKELLP